MATTAQDITFVKLEILIDGIDNFTSSELGYYMREYLEGVRDTQYEGHDPEALEMFLVDFLAFVDAQRS